MGDDIEYRVDPDAPLFSLDVNASSAVGHTPAFGLTRERWVSERTGLRPKGSRPIRSLSYAQLAEEIAHMTDEQRASLVRTYDRSGEAIGTVCGLVVGDAGQESLESGTVYLDLVTFHVP